MAFEDMQLASASYVPQHNRPVMAGARKDRAVWGEARETYGVGAASKRAQLALSGDVPELRGAVFSRRCQRAAIRREGDRMHDIGMPELREHLGAVGTTHRLAGQSAPQRNKNIS